MVDSIIRQIQYRQRHREIQYYSTQKGLDGHHIGMFKNTNPSLMPSHIGPNAYQTVPVRLESSGGNQYYVPVFAKKQ